MRWYVPNADHLGEGALFGVAGDEHGDVHVECTFLPGAEVGEHRFGGLVAMREESDIENGRGRVGICTYGVDAELCVFGHALDASGGLHEVVICADTERASVATISLRA